MIAWHPQAIIDALYKGDVRAIQRYVTKENINWMSDAGDSLLSLAATAGDLNMKVVRLLIKRGADANVRLREGDTLLHFAAHLLRKDLVAELLRAGCDPNALNEAGQSVLAKVLLAFNPKVDLVEMLLKHGADPANNQLSGESAIELAARTGQSELFSKR